ALRGDGGRRAARAASGRRSRRLSRRRPARQDGSGLDGALAGDAGALPGPARRGLRAGAARQAEGAWIAEEGRAAARRRPAPAAADRPGAQARVLDPGGGVAARRARAVRPRDALGRRTPAAGVLPAGGRRARDRRPRLESRGSVPSALGPAVLHALVRAPRRARAARRPRPRGAGRTVTGAGDAPPAVTLPPGRLRRPTPRFERSGENVTRGKRGCD